MRMNDFNPSGVDSLARSIESSVRVGRVIGSTLDGRVVVDFPGNTQGPIVARVLEAGHAWASMQPDADVLLFFENGDLLRPIVLGALTGSAADARSSPPIGKSLSKIEGDVVELDGRKQLTLRCGKSSISLFADGRIVLKGTRLVSRASEVNKIKGAVIALN